MMKKNSIALLLLFICLIMQAETIDMIVAKVGREVILKSELDKRYQELVATGMAKDGISREDLLNDMIEAELILIKARENEIEVDKYTVKKMAEQELEDLSKQFDNELEFRKELKEETGLTVNELKDYYEKLITEQKLRATLITDEITSQIHVTDAEIEEYYNENQSEIPVREAADKIGMILIKIEPSKETKEKLKKEIYEIKDLLNKGGDFAELARKYSDCPSSAKGGDLGYVEKGMTVKPFEEVAFGLEQGEVSNLVETELGYHLILLQEKKDDQIKVSHILKKLEPSQKDIDDANKLIEEIHTRIKNGEDFGGLAREYSQDDSSSVNNGIIGEFQESKYPELFSSYLTELDYGEITDVIQEGDNLYIFDKIEAVPARSYTYKELYDQLKDKVQYKKQVELYNKWIEELKAKTYIEIFI